MDIVSIVLSMFIIMMVSNVGRQLRRVEARRHQAQPLTIGALHIVIEVSALVMSLNVSYFGERVVPLQEISAMSKTFMEIQVAIAATIGKKKSTNAASQRMQFVECCTVFTIRLVSETPRRLVN